jgi:hypothetical protein
MNMEANGSVPRAGTNRLRIFLIAAILAFVFVPSRLFVLHFVKPAGNDTELYARYAYIHRLASERGVSFHKLYRDMGFAAVARLEPSTFRTFDSAALTVALTVVAYPPFTVAVLRIPALFVGRSCAGVSAFTVQYTKIYRWFCAAAEIAAMVVVCLMILMLYRDEKISALVFRMSLLCLTGLILSPILYDRLDMILSALLVLSLALLIRKSMLLSFFVFALAVNFKLIPVFLFPVWIVGSFHASDFVQPYGRARVVRMVTMALTRGLLLCLFTAGVMLFFYVTEGRDVFDFLQFHFGRGIHIESVWGAFSLLASRLFGTSFHISWSGGSFNVVTPATPALAALAFPVMAVILTAATVIIAIRFALGREVPAGGRVVEAALLFLCIVFTFSKIFSPQYLLPLVPLVALLPYTGRGAFPFSCAFVGVCFLSTLIYPYFYGAILNGPTWFGLYLLTVRTLLLVGMTGFLFIRQFSGMGGRHKDNSTISSTILK